MAVASCFTDVSTPTQTDSAGSATKGRSPGSSQAAHHAGSTNPPSVETKRFSIMRA
jgi:hypothetical protein